MITYKQKIVKEEVPVKVICDVCKKEYDCDKDIMEVQEFHHIFLEGGYNSVFGDGKMFEADICQNCINNLIGKHLREIVPEADEEIVED